MKKIFLLLLIVITFSSCDKEKNNIPPQISQSDHLQAPATKDKVNNHTQNNHKQSATFLNESVAVFYIIPSDKQFNQRYYDSLTSCSLQLQEWYEKKTGETFRLNNPVVTTLWSSHSTVWFNSDNGISGNDPLYYFFYNTFNDIQVLTGGWDPAKYMYAVYVDAPGGTGAGYTGFCALPEHDLLGLAGLQSEPSSRWVGGSGHEWGHGFGLPHTNPQVKKALMWTGYPYFPNCILLPYEKQLLVKNNFFKKN